MDELRRDLRAAFARRQEGLGDLAGARERVMREAVARHRAAAEPPLRLAAGLLAVLLAAAGVAALVLARHATPARRVTPAVTAPPTVEPSPTSPPAPARSAFHATTALGVPDTEPVILFIDGADPGQVDGVTWDGRAAGSVGPADLVGALDPEPTGHLYQSLTAIRDRAGQVVGQAPTDKSTVTWSDDGRHYCRIDAASPPPAGGTPATLQLGAPGEPARGVTQVGTVHEQAAVSMAACSVSSDRAVVVQRGGGQFDLQTWVVQLSTGRILWTRSYDPANPVSITASRDGRFVAEMTTALGSGGPPAVTTVIRDATGAVAGRVSGSVLAFSWDASLAVVVNARSADGPISVIQWQDGITVWSVPPGPGPSSLQRSVISAFPEPGGQRIAVVLVSLDPSTVRSRQPADIYAVGPDGRPQLLVEDT
jgi:hypothetical protein